jgi:hypothetical protein
MIAGKAANRTTWRRGISARVGNNPRSGISRVLAAGLAVMFIVLAAGDLCRGAATPDARAACCKRPADRCTRVSVDDCCTQGDQRSTRMLPAPTPVPERDATAGPLVFTLATPTDIVAQPLPGTRPSPHVLHSVFLI